MHFYLAMVKYFIQEAKQLRYINMYVCVRKFASTSYSCSFAFSSLGKNYEFSQTYGSSWFYWNVSTFMLMCHNLIRLHTSQGKDIHLISMNKITLRSYEYKNNLQSWELFFDLFFSHLKFLLIFLLKTDGKIAI